MGEGLGCTCLVHDDVAARAGGCGAVRVETRTRRPVPARRRPQWLWPLWCLQDCRVCLQKLRLGTPTRRPTGAEKLPTSPTRPNGVALLNDD